MFGSKNSNSESPKNAVGPLPQGALNSLVGGTQGEGNITAESDSRIDGLGKGIRDWKGKGRMGRKGSVVGGGLWVRSRMGKQLFTGSGFGRDF